MLFCLGKWNVSHNSHFNAISFVVFVAYRFAYRITVCEFWENYIFYFAPYFFDKLPVGKFGYFGKNFVCVEYKFFVAEFCCKVVCRQGVGVV